MCSGALFVVRVPGSALRRGRDIHGVLQRRRAHEEHGDGPDETHDGNHQERGADGVRVGGAHRALDGGLALDQSRPLRRSAARLVALLGAIADLDRGDPAPGLSWVDPLGSAEQWRAAWAGVGIVCDSLSSQVLTLNLALRGTAPAGTRVHVRADGDPVGRDIVRTVRAEVPDAILWLMDDTTSAYEEELLDDLIRDLDRRGRRLTAGR